MKSNGILTILTHTHSVEKLNRIEKEYKEKSGFFCNAIPLHRSLHQ